MNYVVEVSVAYIVILSFYFALLSYFRFFINAWQVNERSCIRIPFFVFSRTNKSCTTDFLLVEATSVRRIPALVSTRLPSRRVTVCVDLDT